MRGKPFFSKFCRRVTLTDVRELLEKLRRLNTRGSRVDEKLQCANCKKSLMKTDPRYAVDIVLFVCSHFAHKQCSERVLACPVCVVRPDKD